MPLRKLLAIVFVVCLGVAGSVVWFLVGERDATRERAQLRPAPIPTSQALRPGQVPPARVAVAPASVTAGEAKGS